MAYMSQEKKKQIAANLKVALKNTGLKWTLGVHNHSTIVMKITKGPVDFIGNYLETLAQKPEYERARVGQLTGSRMTYMRVNDYHYDSQFTGNALDLLKMVIREVIFEEKLHCGRAADGGTNAHTQVTDIIRSRINACLSKRFVRCQKCIDGH